jgi:hypothetical protein
MARNTTRTVAKVGKIREVLHMTPIKVDQGKAEPQGFNTASNPGKVTPIDHEDFRDF